MAVLHPMARYCCKSEEEYERLQRWANGRNSIPDVAFVIDDQALEREAKKVVDRIGKALERAFQ